MTMRTAEINRKTAETDIMLTLNLDGTGKSTIATGVGFLDHMLTLFAAHGKFDLTVNCQGDTYVDDHHSAEDIGICLGKAFSEALGEKRGITRYGSFLLPMDEALIQTAVDISGRSFLGYGLEIPTEQILPVPGVVSGISAVIGAVTEPGDGVIIQTPVYTPFYNVPRNLGRKL